MRLAVNLTGLKESRDTLKRAAVAAGITANEATAEIAERVLAEVLSSIQGGAKTGRIYRRYNPIRIHQASAPGQAPADDLGTLANSYEIKYTRVNQYAWRATVGSPLAYAAALEYGNPTTNLLPRPHLEPAVRSVEDEVDGILMDSWKRMAP